MLRSTSSKEDNLLEKLKEMARNSNTDESFDTKKFADLLDDYTKGTYYVVRNLCQRNVVL